MCSSTFGCCTLLVVSQSLEGCCELSLRGKREKPWKYPSPSPPLLPEAGGAQLHGHRDLHKSLPQRLCLWPKEKGPAELKPPYTPCRAALLPASPGCSTEHHHSFPNAQLGERQHRAKTRHIETFCSTTLNLNWGVSFPHKHSLAMFYSSGGELLTTSRWNKEQFNVNAAHQTSALPAVLGNTKGAPAAADGYRGGWQTRYTAMSCPQG